MTNPNGAIEIFVFKGSRFLGSRCYSKSTIVIGRHRDATLKLQDPAVSERHAVLRVEGSDLVLADATGQDGVLINGEPMSVCRVTGLDEITIGPFRLKITVLGQEEEDAGFGGELQETPVVSMPADQLAAAPGPSEPLQPAPALFPDEGLTGLEREDPTTIPRGGWKGQADVLHEEFDDSDTQVAAETPFRPPAVSQPTRNPPTASAATAAQKRKALDGEVEGFLQQRAPQPAALEIASQTEQLADDFEIATTQPAIKEKVKAEPTPTPVIEEATPAPLLGAPVVEDADVALSDLEQGSEGSIADDDDDEEEEWIEPFSLLENIVRERFKGTVTSESYSIIEAIQYAGNEIVDLLRASPGQSVCVGADSFHLISLENDGRAFLYFREDFTGTLVAKAKARSIKNFINDTYRVEGFDDLYAVVLKEGDYAQILVNNIGYLIRFVQPPTIPKAEQGFRFRLDSLQVFAASLACHILIFVLLGVLSTNDNLSVEGEADRFAKVALKDLNLEKAMEEAEPKTEAPKDETKPAPPPKEAPKQAPKIVRRRVPAAARSTQPSAAQQARIQKKQVANVLSALENLKPAGAGPGRSDLKALASNISAVRVRGGASSGFKVSGVIGKIGGGGIRLASGIGGGGGKDTRVGSQLLSGGSSVGRVTALAGTGTRVRGRVAKAPTRSISAKGGVLDRGAIQQVVSRHMHEVQACYERQLLTSPGLAGKIVFDWVISPSGSVASARQVSSSMSKPAVASCVLALIRTWQFPKPVGGAVQVRYPFVFRVQGF